MACTACKPCCCPCDCICTGCCGNYLPRKLFGTITNVSGCECLPGACVFNYDDGNAWWKADLGPVCGSNDRTITFICNVGIIRIVGFATDSTNFFPITPIAGTCCPLDRSTTVTIGVGGPPNVCLNTGDSFT